MIKLYYYHNLIEIGSCFSYPSISVDRSNNSYRIASISYVTIVLFIPFGIPFRKCHSASFDATS